jgi:hypothetical protein
MKLLRNYLSANTAFNASHMAAFMVGFAVIGSVILGRGSAADCSSYPAAPNGTASINLCASSVDHTLPAKFWGYGAARYFYQDFGKGSYQNLLKQVSPEVLRWSEAFNDQDPGTPSSPDLAEQNVLSLDQYMKANGDDMGLSLQFNSGPATLPTTVSPSNLTNYDQTGNRSPQNHAAMVGWFLDNGADVIGYAPYNEPANNGQWYTGSDQTTINKREAWAYVHQRIYADAVRQAMTARGRTIKIMGGVLGTGEGYGTGWANSFFNGTGGIISSGGGWPWPDTNLVNLSSGPIFDDYDFHPYPAGGSDIQSGLNSLAYPTLVNTNLSSLYAFMQTARGTLDGAGAASKGLVMDEGGIDTNTNVDALTEGAYAVLMARYQAQWNVPFFTLWSANTTSSGGQGIWPLFTTPDHTNFSMTEKAYAAEDIYGKFLHNYKKQITGYGVKTVAGSGMTPGGAYSNSVERIQATAGVSADGTKMAVLAVNMDLNNSQPFQINTGTTPSADITATYMTQSTPVGHMPTSAITAASSFTRTMEPGSVYLFEIPITPSTPAPGVTLTAAPPNIASGGSSTLSWSSTDATSCSAVGGWTASTATSGTKSVSPSSTTTYTLNCTGDGGSGSANATVTVLATTATIKSRSVVHTVDGSLNESDWSLSRSVSNTVGGTTADAATWGAVWDSNYLYVGVKVIDSNLSTTPGFSAINYWKNDSVEIYLDPNADGGTAYDALDKQLAQVWNDNGLYGGNSSTAGVLHAWAASVGGYSVEMAIPWSSLSVSPANGTVLGIDTGINDAIGGLQVGQLMWNGTANNYQDPSNFGLAGLSNLPAGKPGDLNGDGSVDGADLAILAANYKTSNAVADINDDNIVDIVDLSIVLSNYGP